VIFDESIFGPLHTLREPIVFAHTNFGEDILIGGDDMPPERNFKKHPLAVKFYFWLSGLPGQSSEYVHVTVQTFIQIGQSMTNVQQFNLLDLSAVRHIRFLKKASLDHSTRCRLPLSMYTPNLVKIALSAAENAPETKF